MDIKEQITNLSNSEAQKNSKSNNDKNDIPLESCVHLKILKL